MWFGTQNYMTWIEPPLHGAESSPQTWSSDGTFLNGHGYAFSANNSHKVYNYAWSGASSREDAQRMKSFADGSYGQGKIYFTEPHLYDLNVLPARWASPGMTANFEGPSLVPGIDATLEAPSTNLAYGLPVQGATYEFESYTQPDPRSAGLFIPVPPGHVVHITAFGTPAGTGSAFPQIYATRVGLGGDLIAPRNIITPVAPSLGSHELQFQSPEDWSHVMPASGSIGVQLWIGGSNTDSVVSGTITVRAIQVRILPSNEDFINYSALAYTGWQGGMGNAGTRFVGKPTYVTHNRINGGQIEYAATFKEVLF